MPYIPKGHRWDLELWSTRIAETPGELNFQITGLIVEYLVENGLDYQHINDVRGVLVCAGEEFNRRIVGTYEDVKIALNGDVYEALLPPKKRDSDAPRTSQETETDPEAATGRDRGAEAYQGRFNQVEVGP